MKKSIAFIVIGLFILSAAAQKPNTSAPKSISPISIGRSANYQSVYYPQQNLLSYNQEFDMLGFTRCGGPALGTENQVYNSFSNDGGSTWDSTALIYDNPDFPARFPSGALFNPMGNTDLNNLYSIVAGPAMVNDTAFGATFIAWKKRSGTAKNLIINHGNRKRMDFNHFQICTNGKFYFNGYAHSKDGNKYTKWEHTLVSGTLNATNDTVENVTTTTLNPPFAKFGTDTVGSANYSAAVAFNKAGTVGYYVFIGVRGDVPNPETKTGYRPIVYKTLDGGTNWDLQPDFNFAAIPDFNEVLPGIWQDPTDIRPSFSEINDLIVDGNNNLHILSYVYGQYTSNTDSLEKTWDFPNIQGIMYDSYTSATGWQSALIDVQNTKDHIAIDSMDVDITNRLQGGISTDGSIVVYSWADSDPSMVIENVLPDLYITGRHINSSSVFLDKMNITAGNDLQYGATYHTMAPQVKINGSSQCFYPYLMVSQLGAASSTDPVNYLFIDGLSFCYYNPDTVAIAAFQTLETVVKIYPNPVSDLLTLEIGGNNQEQNFECINTMGQIIYRGKIFQKCTVNTSGFSEGVYVIKFKNGKSVRFMKSK
jgi:hypothetical protein